MAEFASLPLFTDALMADCGHLSDEEFGRYMRLLIIMWRNPDCCIPNDEKWICRRLRINSYDDVGYLIEEFFQLNSKGMLHQKRLTKEYEYVKSKKKKNKKAADIRWKNTPNEQGIDNKQKEPMQTHMQMECERNAPTPTPTPTLKKKKNIKKEKSDFGEFWNLCPRKVGKGLAEKSYWKARDEVSKDRLHAAMRSHKSECADKEEQFIPHPATWLNQGRYMDDAYHVIDDKADWPEWKHKIAAIIGEDNVKSWLKDSEYKNGALYLNGEFRRKWVNEHFGDVLSAAGLKEIKKIGD